MIDHGGIDQDWGCPAQGEGLLFGACESCLGQALECAAGGSGAHTGAAGDRADGCQTAW